MKIAFYLDNSNYKDVDFSNPKGGNPGVRGTQYMIWIVASLLNEKYDDLSIILFANNIQNMPHNLTCFEAANSIDALKKAEFCGCDFFVFRPISSDLPRFFIHLKETHVKVITWNHNYEEYPLLQQISLTDNVVANIDVGKQQLDRIIDHDAWRKSQYIFNGLQMDLYKTTKKREIYGNYNVVYCGALEKQKGFHVLAKEWKKIKRAVPGAQLHIVGSGKIGSDQRNNPLDTLDSKYRALCCKYLSDRTGNIMESVHFHGSLAGFEKQSIMSSAKVGIANPSGKTETFCIVATEFEAYGVPVVSAKRGGLLDTVVHGSTGYLARNSNQLASYIIRLLINDEENERCGAEGRNFVERSFSISLILKKWHDLFVILSGNGQLINNDKPNHTELFSKKIRFLNYKIRKRLHFVKPISFWDYTIRRMHRKLLFIKCQR